MIPDQPSFEPDLLFLCAILRWFDQNLLQTLTGQDEGRIEALLSSELTIEIAGQPGAYRLHPDIRQQIVAQLRSEMGFDESTLHKRVFAYFLRQTRESTLRRQAEDGCIYHLGELFLLIAARQDWQILSELVGSARDLAPPDSRIQHWLAFYEGFVAIRTHAYDQGEALLNGLLDQPALEPSLRVRVLNALGNSCWAKSDYDSAIGLYQQVLAHAQASDDTFYQGVALANMGLIYSEIEYHEQALDLTTQSLEIFRALGDHSREAHALYESGRHAMKLGRWQLARSYFDQAIALYEKLGNRSGLAYSYWGRGFLHHMLGEDQHSEAAYQRSGTIMEQEGRSQTSLSLDIAFRLGFLYQTQARWGEALTQYERARELAHQLRSPYSANLIQYRLGNVYQHQGRLEQAFNAYAQAIDGIEALRGATETEEIKLGLLGTAQQVYESIVLLCLALDRPAEAFHYVERARSRAFLDLLAKKSPELYAAHDRPVATLAEVQSRLGEDALLLEYFTIGVLPRGESLVNQLPPENARLREHLTLAPQTLIFAITRDCLEILRPKLDPNTLRPQPGDPGPSRRLLRDRLLTHFHTQLIAPAEPLLRSRELLYLIPHGPLHYVPFMALRSADGAHLLHTAGPAIALAPSATVLLRNCLSRPPLPADNAMPLLALGCNAEGEAGLRYAEAEASHVAQLAGGQAWVGPAARSRRLIEQGQQARRLHIAGHAVYDPHDPLGSYVQLDSGDSLSARAIMSELVLEADLVTLSACMSGLSQVMLGDELMGLQRAFLYAGAPAVVCTLWEAADFVALLVMDHFYTGLHNGSRPAVALRDAQVALRSMTGRDLLATLDRWRAEDPAFVAALGELPEVPAEALDAEIYTDPFYWAPFMLIGKPD